MPKTIEEIKAEVTTLVKSQGNQGAISLGTVLDDIAELAGEGGGGGGGGTELPFELVSITINTGSYGYIAAQEGVATITEADAAKLKAALDANKVCMVAINMHVDQSDSTDWPHFLETPALAQARKEFTCPDSGGTLETHTYGIYLTSTTFKRDSSVNNCIFVVDRLDTTSPEVFTIDGDI